MGEWKTTNLNELPRLLAQCYPNELFAVGIDRNTMTFYLVPSSMGLDESIETVDAAAGITRVSEIIKASGSPGGIILWVEKKPSAGGSAMDTKAAEKDLGDFFGSVDGPGADAAASDTDILAKEFEKLQEESAELEDAIVEKEDEIDSLNKTISRYGAFLSALFNEFGGEGETLPEDVDEKIEKVFVYIKEASSALGDDLDADVKTLNEELEKVKEEKEDLEKKLSGKEKGSDEDEELLKQLEVLKDKKYIPVDTWKHFAKNYKGPFDDLLVDIKIESEEKNSIEMCNVSKTLEVWCTLIETEFKAVQEKEGKGAPAEDGGLELVEADKAHRTAKMDKEEFEKAVDEGTLSPFKDGFFKKTDILEFVIDQFKKNYVPQEQYDSDLESAKGELPDDHGKEKCISLEEYEKEKKQIEDEKMSLQDSLKVLEEKHGEEKCVDIETYEEEKRQVEDEIMALQEQVTGLEEKHGEGKCVDIETYEEEKRQVEDEIMALQEQVTGLEEKHGEGKCVDIETYEEEKRQVEDEIMALQEQLDAFDEIHGEGKCVDIETYTAEKQKAEDDMTMLQEQITGLEQKYDELTDNYDQVNELLESYRMFFDENLYDRDFAEKAVSTLEELDIAPRGFSVNSFIPVIDEGGNERYRIPYALVSFVNNYEKVQFLTGKIQELEKQILDQEGKSEDLSRKITNYEEAEAEISTKLTEEKEDLEELGSILGELEKSDLERLRETINNLVRFKKGAKKERSSPKPKSTEDTDASERVLQMEIIPLDGALEPQDTDEALDDSDTSEDFENSSDTEGFSPLDTREISRLMLTMNPEESDDVESLEPLDADEISKLALEQESEKSSDESGSGKQKKVSKKARKKLKKRGK